MTIFFFFFSEIKTTEEVKLMAEMYRNLDMEQLKVCEFLPFMSKASGL